LKNYLKDLLTKVRTIAIVGASSNNKRDSYNVMKYLTKKGYNVIPVNPNEANNKILGKKCVSNLKEIQIKVDMVDIFRAKEFVLDITKDAIDIGAEIIWTQEGIIDKESSIMAKNAGIIFIMDECPKKVLEN
tara:strand:+ start:885 stop:1280 length:396 start_codon:yes stop_codon:yes gene_type:complete